MVAAKLEEYSRYKFYMNTLELEREKHKFEENKSKD